MNLNLFRNKEIKILFLMLSILFAAATFLNMFIINHICTDFSLKMQKREVIIASKLIKAPIKSEANIINAFKTSDEVFDLSNSTNSKNFASDLKLVSKYGYLDYKNIKSYPCAYNMDKTLTVLSSIILIAVFVFAVIVVYLIINKIYYLLHQLSYGAEKIMNGNFDIHFSEKGEGELSILCFQFNQMSDRLKFTLDELTKEKEALKKLISDISHQLKTPLASLKIYDELILDEVNNFTFQNQPSALDDIKINIKNFGDKMMIQLNRMEWLIKSMLKISRLQYGEIQLHMVKKDLAETIKSSIEILRNKFEAKNQTLNFNVTGKPSPFLHDKEWMVEAIKNIINNAIDYTNTNGQIHVSLDFEGSMTKIVITDTGIGIPQNELPHIFERFYQGKNSKGINKESTGLGLALSKLIIEKHNGAILVKSKVNVGTSFTISFMNLI